MRACMWGGCNGEVPDGGGQCYACGKNTQFRNKQPAEIRTGIRTHELKVWPEPFRSLMAGRKKHEIRKFDRDFQVGDLLILKEWDPHPAIADDVRGYTGQEVKVRISYITPPGQWGLPQDIGVLSIERLPPDD